ncbi:MAG: hypothetical protein ACOC7L_01230 [Acidobacteriota bacterium]
MSPTPGSRRDAASRSEAASETAHLGRRGGKTTATPARIRKTFWVDQDAEDALRRDAEASGLPESEVFRQVLRRHYGLPDF